MFKEHCLGPKISEDNPASVLLEELQTTYWTKGKSIYDECLKNIRTKTRGHCHKKCEEPCNHHGWTVSRRLNVGGMCTLALAQLSAALEKSIPQIATVDGTMAKGITAVIMEGM